VIRTNMRSKQVPASIFAVLPDSSEHVVPPLSIHFVRFLFHPM
jgi:hypothetical protein